ncbi:MAG: 50S ribosomal protein L22 [Candidatus Komeilibacteria bacterium]|nr:50S ribosomal protein L22 [Candidatus Komeilibacteria bacterium]
MSALAEKSVKQKTKKPLEQEKEVNILSSAETKTKAPKSAKETTGPVLVRASLRYLRMSAKKVRLVVNAIKGLPVNEALNRLPLINKLAVREVTKLLQSAMANAEHNFKLNKADLYIKSAVANDGPSLHRWIPAAFGSAHPIKKRSCHIEIVLAVKEGKPAGVKKAVPAKKSARLASVSSERVAKKELALKKGKQ